MGRTYYCWLKNIHKDNQLQLEVRPFAKCYESMMVIRGIHRCHRWRFNRLHTYVVCYVSTDFKSLSYVDLNGICLSRREETFAKGVTSGPYQKYLKGITLTTSIFTAPCGFGVSGIEPLCSPACRKRRLMETGRGLPARLYQQWWKSKTQRTT